MKAAIGRSGTGEEALNVCAKDLSDKILRLIKIGGGGSDKVPRANLHNRKIIFR